MSNRKVSVLLRREMFPNDKIAEAYKQHSIKATRKTMQSIHNIPDVIYHFTRKENVESILECGLKAGLDGGVFVSTSLEENVEHLKTNIIEADGFLNLFNQEILPNEEKIEDYVIIQGCPVNTYRKNWLTYIDKSSKNQHTLFYLSDILQLKDVKVHIVSELI